MTRSTTRRKTRLRTWSPESTLGEQGGPPGSDATFAPDQLDLTQSVVMTRCKQAARRHSGASYAPRQPARPSATPDGMARAHRLLYERRVVEMRSARPRCRVRGIAAGSVST